MGRKALLSAGVFLSGYPLLQVIYSIVVIVLSVVQQKRSKPYLAGKHVIREDELEGATITRVKRICDLLQLHQGYAYHLPRNLWISCWRIIQFRRLKSGIQWLKKKEVRS